MTAGKSKPASISGLLSPDVSVTPRLALRLTQRHPLAPGVLHLTLEQASDDVLAFKSGQFIQLFLTDTSGQVLRRSYSIANPPPAEGAVRHWELAVSLLPDGRASHLLQTLPLGGIIPAAGPFGRFHLMPSDAPRRLLLVATGTGVAPFRSMLPELRRHLDAGTQVALLCGARTREELLYRDQFLTLAREAPGFTYRGCISRQHPLPDEPDLVAGHVQPALSLLEPAAGDLALLCGNPEMVDDCAAFLAQSGLPLRAIRRERYVASG